MHAVVFDLDHTIFDVNQTLHEGVAELLELLQTLGIAVGAVSNKDHRMIVRLDEAGIRNYFSGILCSDHTARPKSVESIHRLILQLGSTLDETALVSHAHSDILLGKEARVSKTIGVSHGQSNTAPLRGAGADHVIPNIPAVLDVLH